MNTQNTMKLGATVLFLMGMSPALAGAVELEVDPAHSSIGFDVKHLMTANVHGNFTDFKGDINLNEKDFSKSKVKFTVNVNSITTLNAKRDAHLKSPDFFNGEKYPEATFVSTSIKPDGKDYILEGDLSFHGVTKKTQFKLTTSKPQKDPYGVEKRIFQATTELSRKDFGLIYNAPLEAGGVVISDQVKLAVDLEAAPRTAGAAK